MMPSEEMKNYVNDIRRKLYTWIGCHGGRKPSWLIIDGETLHKIKPHKDERGTPAYTHMYGEIPRFDGYPVAVVNVVDEEIIEFVEGENEQNWG
jgi:hypothetical protein